MKNIDKDIADYKAAYLAANGKDIEVKAQGQGWYKLPNGDRVRSAFFKGAAEVLNARAKAKLQPMVQVEPTGFKAITDAERDAIMTLTSREASFGYDDMKKNGLLA